MKMHTGTGLTRKRQHGNMGGYLLIFLLLGGSLTLGSKLVPLYMDHNTMSGLLDKMAEEPGMGAKGDTALRDAMRKRFKLNNIRDFDVKKHTKIDRTGRGTDIIMDYEVRMKLVHNLDIVAAFDKKVELRD
jgi:hypothetical protein